MKKVSALIVTILIFVMYRPRIVHAFTFEPSDVLPGDVLFSPVGKRESKYVGHIGIVTTDKKVLHSIPAGLMKDEPDAYKRKFRKVAHYRPYEEGHRDPLCCICRRFVPQTPGSFIPHSRAFKRPL